MYMTVADAASLGLLKASGGRGPWDETTLERVIPLRPGKGIQIVMDMDTGESMCYEYN